MLKKDDVDIIFVHHVLFDEFSHAYAKFQQFILILHTQEFLAEFG